MKKLSIKAMAAIVVILTAVSLTFVPMLYAQDIHNPLDIDPGDGGSGGWGTVKCSPSLGGSSLPMMYCGSCRLTYEASSNYTATCDR